VSRLLTFWKVSILHALSSKLFILISHLPEIDVKSYLEIHPKRARVFELTFNFLPYESYKSEFGIKPKKIMKYMHETFFSIMFRHITKAAAAKLS
jgi:DNA-directed RNA polymerase I subunit RPA1